MIFSILDDSNKFTYGFEIVEVKSKKSRAFAVTTEEVRDLWVKDFRAANDKVKEGWEGPSSGRDVYPLSPLLTPRQRPALPGRRALHPHHDVSRASADDARAGNPGRAERAGGRSVDVAW